MGPSAISLGLPLTNALGRWSSESFTLPATHTAIVYFHPASTQQLGSSAWHLGLGRRLRVLVRRGRRERLPVRG